MKPVKQESFTMTQFLADIFDQLDRAIEYISDNDRNSDRFAILFIDNVMELLIHEHAQGQGIWLIPTFNTPAKKIKSISRALKTNKFSEKLKLYKNNGFLSKNDIESAELFDSIIILHNYRNSAYHKGFKYDGLLHSLAFFYIQIISKILSHFSPALGFWSASSKDKFSTRALNYLYKPKIALQRPNIENALKRLEQKIQVIQYPLIPHLTNDIQNIISETYKLSPKIVRVFEKHRTGIKSKYDDDAILLCNKVNEQSKRWNKRLKSLMSEKNPHKALKKYIFLSNEIEPYYESLSCYNDELYDLFRLEE